MSQPPQPQMPMPAPKGKPFPTLSPDELSGGIGRTLGNMDAIPQPRLLHAAKSVKRARVTQTDSDIKEERAASQQIPTPAGNFTFVAHDEWIKHLQKQVETLT